MSALAQPALLDALLALRDPLARIALATSGARTVFSPEEAQRQLDVVQAALADADARIEELARALAGPPAPALEPSADCRAAFAAVCRRAAVASRARGIALDAIADAAPIPGDAAQVRRAALRVLRVACAWAVGGGSVQLALSASPDGAAVVTCTGQRSGAPPRAPFLRELLARFALAERAALRGSESLAVESLSFALALPPAEAAA